jgi:hypothetical protein
MAPQILLGCSKITKTGTTDGQGVGSTREEAIEHAILSVLAGLHFFPPAIPRCPVKCPIPHTGQAVPLDFSVTDEGEFDSSSPWGTIHHVYVKGTLRWSITRTCSKLRFGQFRDSGPHVRKPVRKLTKRPKSR